MNETCEFCRSEYLEPAYGPVNPCSRRVFVCSHCGLVQSRCAGTPANAAGYETRAHRAGAAIEPIGFYADLTQRLNILDLGAGRGTFVREILSNAPRARVTAVEADPYRAWACAFQNRSEVLVKPVEETAFENERFDIAYSAAFECFASPMAVLADLGRALKPGGLLVLDTRNIASLRHEDAVEEWFTPERRFHFSSQTLTRMIRACGFEIIERPDREDRENLLVVAVKTECTPSDLSADLMEVRSAHALISFYRTIRERNLTALASVTHELNRMAPRGIALWGEGALFDSLTQHGGLDPAIFVARLGSAAIPSADIRALRETRPEIIFVMSETHASDIGRFAAEYSPTSEIVHYSDLIYRAYNGVAA